MRRWQRCVCTLVNIVLCATWVTADWMRVHVFTDTVKAVKPEGCRISGILFVQKVPGSLSIALHSEGHSIDLTRVNTSHVVNALSFGKPLSHDMQVCVLHGWIRARFAVV